MPSVRVEEQDECIRVETEAWAIEHLKRAGGAWHSVVFTHGSGKNLLRGPLSSALRFHRSEPARAFDEGDAHGYFTESNEPAPLIRVERLDGGGAAVIAEGAYRNAAGAAVPVGFRRRTEYRAHGLIWTTLEIMSDCGCSGAVEVRAFDLPLRAGLTDAFARFHPTQAGSADLLGGRAWYDLAKSASASPFLSRFTPTQLACYERGVEGLEIFPGSDLAQWDCAFKPDIGLGQYRVGRDAGGTNIELTPYCLAQRRLKIRIQGTTTLRLGIALLDVPPKNIPKKRVQHTFLSTPDLPDSEIELLAAHGIELICYKDDAPEPNSTKKNGTNFWRNGSIAPYDAEGMAALRRTIESCHRCSIKIVPYVSAHELHPETHAYELHARDWMHTAARSLDVIHAWRGAADAGGLMCLRSGWLDYRKKTIDAILSDLPWDGLCLDWPNPLPCCHPSHSAAPFHTDSDELTDLLLYCRQRAGTLVFLGSSDSSITAANLADHILPRE